MSLVFDLPDAAKLSMKSFSLGDSVRAPRAACIWHLQEEHFSKVLASVVSVDQQLRSFTDLSTDMLQILRNTNEATTGEDMQWHTNVQVRLNLTSAYMHVHLWCVQYYAHQEHTVTVAVAPGCILSFVTGGQEMVGGLNH